MKLASAASDPLPACKMLGSPDLPAITKVSSAAISPIVPLKTSVSAAAGPGYSSRLPAPSDTTSLSGSAMNRPVCGATVGR